MFLIFTDFPSNKAVTLLGFSLGTVIINSCIRTLKKFYRNGYLKVGRIISDVFLWGGAAVLNPNGLEEEII